MGMNASIAADVARKKVETAERAETVLKRLKNTRPGETICLMYWEIDILLKHIKNLKG